MNKTAFQQILDQLRLVAGSDAKAAPLVGITQPSFSQWRRGHAFPDDEQAMKIAEVLQLAPEYVLAAVRADRTTSRKARAVWVRIAEQFGKAAAVAALAISAGVSPAPSSAAPLCLGECATGSCVLCKTRRRFFPTLTGGAA